MDAIQKAGEQIDQIIRKMEAAHHYATTPYLMEEDIVDFDGGILEKGQEDEGLCGQKDK
jgi:hypothetical protein